MTTSVPSMSVVVDEIMRIHRSLPNPITAEEIEAAKALIRNVDSEEHSRLESISKQIKMLGVPDELFNVYIHMQKNWVRLNANEQKREALKLLEIDDTLSVFDELIQRANMCISSSISNLTRNLSRTNNSIAIVSKSDAFNKTYAIGSTTSTRVDKKTVNTYGMLTRDDSHVDKTTKTVFNMKGVRPDFRPSDSNMMLDSSLKLVSTSGLDGEKMSLIKLANLIEVFSKKGAQDLKLKNKLTDQIDWLPDSIGKLSSLITLDLSENRIVSLPATIGGLSSLTRLNLHENKIIDLPESIGDLLSLVYFNLGSNQLTSLPPTFGRLVCLEELDLSSNQFRLLPETIGSLILLKVLNVEMNNIEEIPYTIGHCSSLTELRADYNKLKALPEAVGKIETLQILSARYNNIKLLPTTISSLTALRELDMCFNELESVPEGLCFATMLTKLNLSNNFADMQTLPRSIGNLEMLEELDISNNQIRFIPDSFRMLSRLRILHAEENPLEVPPRDVAEMGAQAVVKYMSDLVAKMEVKAQPVEKKKSWGQTLFFSRSHKKKHNLLII